jgi:hypothetical protein
LLLFVVATFGCANGSRTGASGAGSGDADSNGAAEVWTQSSFRDFIQGRFGDGGNNTYVSAKGRLQLVNRWDLNNDGYIDLVFANSHPQAEKLDAMIYWGNGKDYDSTRVTAVPHEGAQWFVTADLNNDGKLDAVAPNYANGTWTKMGTFVYYAGDENSPQPVKDAQKWNNPPYAWKQVLPSDAAQNAAVGDLNKDGFPDIVVALSSGFWEYRGSAQPLLSPSRIFWGSKDGYSPNSSLDIEASGASDVAVEDLNKDGWLDLVFANRERGGKFDIESFVYFGAEGQNPFSPERRTPLPTNQANAVTVADVNGDGFKDVLFANGLGPASTIYLSDGGRFSADRKIDLPTSEARDVVAADLNGDKRADVFFTNHQTAGNPLTKSYLYWNTGSAGAEAFAADNRQELETVGAWGVTASDLNKDGRIDLVVSNFKEHESYEIPSYIFWNSDKGFADLRRTSIFTKGAVGNTVADFNGDGHLDVMFNNTSNRYRGGVGPLFVYWGNSKGTYSSEQRTDLPSVEPYDWASGDLNDDGWPDLVVANMAEIGRRYTENFIYWGSPQGYTVDNRTAIMGKGTRGIAVADFDRNGHLDLFLFCTHYLTDKDTPIYIYWGEPHGFVTTERTELPGSGNGLPLAADLNSDGLLDLIIPGMPEKNAWIYWGDGTRNYSPDRKYEVPDSKGTSSTEVADMNNDGHLDLMLMRRGDNVISLVYYGDGRGGFSPEKRDEFQVVQTQGATVADINKDGWLDVVTGRYSDKGSRATKSRLHFGSPNGLSEDNMLELPTHAGTGSMISDFNSDGHNDLLFYCHRSEGDPNKPGRFGDHCTDSYLYWGSKQGFSFDRKHLIPGQGVHYDGGADLGNIKDRSMQFDYISPAHQFSQGKSGHRIEWKAQTPKGTRVKFQVRSAASENELASAEWTGPRGGGKDSYFERSGASFDTPEGHTWVQYRAVLESANGSNSPVIESVSLSFR